MTDFRTVYTEELTRAVTERPQEYMYPVSEVPGVVRKMLRAILAGSFNKNGIALTRTARRLGIPYTYAGFKAYVTAHPEQFTEGDK